MNIVPNSWPRKGSKYKNQITEVDGIKFDSKKEAKRYLQLKMLEKCGNISDLFLQVHYPISVKGEKICTYIADFTYTDNETDTTVVEDVKGMLTELYKIKKKLMFAVYRITIKET